MLKPILLSLVFMSLILCEARGQSPEASKSQPRPQLVTRYGLRNHTAEQLLEMPAVRKDLEFSPDQEQKFVALKRKADEMYKELSRQESERQKDFGDDRSSESFKEFRQAQGMRSRALTAEITVSYVKILSKEQRFRLKQVGLQVDGAGAFLNPDVRERLNMSPEQAEQILEIIASGRQELRQNNDLEQQMVRESLLRTDAANGEDQKAVRNEKGAMVIDPKKRADVQKSRAKFFSNGEDIHAGIMSAIARVLTKRQRENYHKMLGRPFNPNPLPGEDLKGEPKDGKQDELKKAAPARP